MEEKPVKISEEFVEEKPIKIPDEFMCPISTQMMEDPVVAGDGITYQRRHIQLWFTKSNNSPWTNLQLPHKTLIPNIALKNSINNFRQEMPKIMKMEQIKKDSEYAVNMKLQQMNDFQYKMQNKTKAFSENEQTLKKKNQMLENKLHYKQTEIKSNQEIKLRKMTERIEELENSLLKQKRAHQFTQKRLQNQITLNIQLNDKYSDLEVQLKQTKKNLEQLKLKLQSCTCKKQKHNFESSIMNEGNTQYSEIKFEQQKIERLINNPKQTSSQNNMEGLKVIPQKIQKLLENVKRINITLNQNGLDTQKRYVKVDNKNNNICTTNYGWSSIFSNEELPMKNKQSFYFSIKAIQILNNNCLGIGIAYPKDITKSSISGQYNRIAYGISKKKIYIFDSFTEKQPYSSQLIQKYPSQVICFVSKNEDDKNISIIYNNEVQMKIPLQNQMLQNQRKCYAFIKFDGKIELI